MKKYLLTILLFLTITVKAQVPPQLTVVHIIVSVDSTGKYCYEIKDYVLCDNRYNIKVNPSSIGNIHISALNTNDGRVCYFKSNYDDPLPEEEQNLYITLPLRPENITIKIWKDSIDTKYLKIIK